MPTKYAEVAFQRQGGNTLDFFTYEIPTDIEVEKGFLVKVPFLRISKNALVFNVHSSKPDFPTKKITEVLKAEKLVPDFQLELMKWMAQYYFCSIHTVLKQFIPKTIFEEKKHRAMKAKTTELPSESDKKTLTPAQTKVLSTIQKSNDQIFLLHGVTGAGKTEIYLQLAKALKNNEQLLILVPEISLTPQLIEYFAKGCQEEIISIHSRLTERQKTINWQKIKQGEARIVIGSRSALFTPWQNLKYIVMDEEQEWSYKQDQSPRYHTRKVCEKICTLLPGTKLILGSATPSIESYYKAKEKTYNLIELPQRFNQNELPKVDIVDLREELQKGNYSIFSDLLHEKIKEKLDKKEQVILFLNRRGHSSSILCRDCGQSIKCKNCDVALTYHQSQNQARLICHYCSVIEKVPAKCPNCSSTHIKYIGIGTQKIESEIRKLFPLARTLRADRDTTTHKDIFAEIYQKLKNHEIDVLIGTQMIGKGLHLPKVTLVGVILADIGIHVPDFRSSEKTFQTLTQVAGRTGRIIPGEVVIQSYLPDHPSIEATKTHDYHSFYAQEIKNRLEASYPPFTEIIRLLITDPKKEKAKAELERILHLTSNINLHNTEILAHPDLIEKIHNKYRFVITLKGPKAHLLVEKLLPELTKWKIDRDPYWN